VKSLFIVCGLVGLALGIATSCGPKESFCPNNPPLYNCYETTGTGGAGGGGQEVQCDGAAFVVCNGVTQCPPCS